MVFEIMNQKTIIPEYHQTNFDGYTYTKPGEVYNPSTEIKKEIVHPVQITYTSPEYKKIELPTGYITVIQNEGYPQVLQEDMNKLNFPALMNYEHCTAINDDIRIVNQHLHSTKTKYSNNFLNTVKI